MPVQSDETRAPNSSREALTTAFVSSRDGWRYPMTGNRVRSSLRGERTTIGTNATVRSGSVIYGDVRIGDNLTTGHGVLIREGTVIGDDVLIGTNSVIDGSVEIGSRVSIQTGAYVPPGTTIGDDVFVGPGAVLTNDPFPIRRETELVGPTIGDSASIGANATLLPGVEIGAGAFVGAGAVVTDDVPPWTLAVGVPAERRSLPAELDSENDIA